MTPQHAAAPQRNNPTAATAATPVRSLYLALAGPVREGDPAIAAAGDWLDSQLQLTGNHGAARSTLAALPSDGAPFAAWLAARQDDIDEQYKQYVAERRAGAPRRLFAARAHALHYLRAIAPARLTDGAWLYGVLAHWDEPALRPLITTYLEELGNGVPDKNHVVIFQQLIDAHGCADWQRLGERHFHDGLTQLALAHHAERFLPELVGYNLGIENADLDTLVAAYEMNELGIDPYYFTLHVTVDNSATGHARLAQEALRQLLAGAAPAAVPALLARVDAGFRLHGRGPRGSELLASFDLATELHGMLARKNLPVTSAGLTPEHADTVRIGNRPLSAWFRGDNDSAALLAALEDEGWFQRGGVLESSRLWSLIDHGESETPAASDDGGEVRPAPPLAGLFSPYELALLADWIAIAPPGAAAAPAAAPSQLPIRRLGATAPVPERVRESAERGIIRHRFPDDEHGWEAIANELSLLEARVVASSSKQEAIALLASLMAPSNHHTSTGLMATRMFSKLFTA